MNRITTLLKTSAVRLLLFTLGLTFLTACKRPEYLKPEDKGLGTISFTLANGTQVNKFDGRTTNCKVYVKSIGIFSDSLYNYLQITADNNLAKMDLQKIECQLRVRKNQAVGDTVIFSRFLYYEGQDVNSLPVIYPLNGANRLRLTGLGLEGTNSQKTLSAFALQDLNCTKGNTARSLKGFNIDVSSFGTIDISSFTNIITFNYNNLYCGSLKQQSRQPRQAMHPYRQPIEGVLGIDTLVAVFEAKDNSPFSKLTFAFKHLDDALAYGPIGEHDYIDGRGTTNISVTGIHRNGTIYTGQKDKGYVYVRDEKVWYLRPSSFEIVPGYVQLEFEFDLVNSAGDVISITGGKANFSTKQ